ncbi:hypothetical protein PIB30_065179 [Stylosanthes scabra]|uniref:Uncharacterized protein n=1 Tax=Stylosanthes scabra TaxID=79078 RepID=A0ABU6WMY9_9FABA|nr:hypothetical protein [Stylosanthes scabra]
MILFGRYLRIPTSELVIGTLSKVGGYIGPEIRRYCATGFLVYGCDLATDELTRGTWLRSYGGHLPESKQSFAGGVIRGRREGHLKGDSDAQRKPQALCKVTLGSLVDSIGVDSRRPSMARWSGNPEVGKSIALIRARWRGVLEVGKSNFTSKASRECRKLLRGSLRILLSELSRTRELGSRVPQDKAHFKYAPSP